jgi:hypothetical protein
MPQREPEKPRRKLDTAEVDWSGEIDRRVGHMLAFMMQMIGEALGEVLRVERAAFVDEIIDLVRLAADHAKLNLKDRTGCGRRDRDRRATICRAARAGS